jgi:phage gp16-like protein
MTQLNRRALLATVHIAKKELGLGDDAYRDVLRRVTRRASAGELSARELVAVIEELRRLGWQPKTPLGRNRRSGNPHVRKVWAVWGDICRAGAARSPTRAALRAFVERMTGLTDPEWLSPEQANQVVEGLKAWQRRHAGKAEDAERSET